MERFLGFLKKTEFCRDMPDGDIRAIADYCHEDTFEPNQVVFFENDDADRVFLIISGEVEIWKAYETPNAESLAVLGSGHLFGEMALIDQLPRSATVVCRKKTRAVHIDQRDFQKLLSDNSAVALSIVKSLSIMVRKSNENYLSDLKEKNWQLEKAYSELKTAQNALLRRERFSNLGKFSSMIFHDIRNPIQLIKVHLDILSLNRSLPDSLQKDLNSIRFEADRLHHLADEFLDYSRGDIRLELGTVDIREFTSDLENSLNRMFTKTETTLSVENRFQGVAVFDQKRMFRALLNIFDNAKKAMASNGRFSLILKKEDHNLVFQVDDNGEGMTEEIMEHIFEPFYSCSGKGGTGLGMLIVKKIVEAHEGTLKIKSTPGKGTSICMTIPQNNNPASTHT